MVTGNPAIKYRIPDVLAKKDQQISTLEEQMYRIKVELKVVTEPITLAEKKVDQVRNPPFAFHLPCLATWSLGGL